MNGVKVIPGLAEKLLRFASVRQRQACSLMLFNLWRMEPDVVRRNALEECMINMWHGTAGAIFKGNMSRADRFMYEAGRGEYVYSETPYLMDVLAEVFEKRVRCTDYDLFVAPLKRGVVVEGLTPYFFNRYAYCYEKLMMAGRCYEQLYVGPVPGDQFDRPKVTVTQEGLLRWIPPEGVELKRFISGPDFTKVEFCATCASHVSRPHDCPTRKRRKFYGEDYRFCASCKIYVRIPHYCGPMNKWVYESAHFQVISWDPYVYRFRGQVYDWCCLCGRYSKRDHECVRIDRSALKAEPYRMAKRAQTRKDCPYVKKRRSSAEF